MFLREIDTMPLKNKSSDLPSPPLTSPRLAVSFLKSIIYIYSWAKSTRTIDQVREERGREEKTALS